jgi:ribonuclease P protein component
VNRKFRLIRSTDFKRVRRLGQSYAHPLIVLIRHPNDMEISRIGIIAGRSIGNAVRRNRAKRRIREVIRSILSIILPGWDIILLARKPIIDASFKEISSAVFTLLERADLLNEQDDN